VFKRDSGLQVRMLTTIFLMGLLYSAFVFGTHAPPSGAVGNASTHFDGLVVDPHWKPAGHWPFTPPGGVHVMIAPQPSPA